MVYLINQCAQNPLLEEWRRRNEIQLLFLVNTPSQWVKYCGPKLWTVDGNRTDSWTEAEAISHAYSHPLFKLKIEFNEAQIHKCTEWIDNYYYVCLLSKLIALNHNFRTSEKCEVDQGCKIFRPPSRFHLTYCQLHKADYRGIHSGNLLTCCLYMLIVSNHSSINVLCLWRSAYNQHTYNQQINNSGQDIVLVTQKLLNDLHNISNKNKENISHFKCLQMPASCSNWSFICSVMIETKLAFLLILKSQSRHNTEIKWYCFVMYIITC